HDTRSRHGRSEQALLARRRRPPRRTRWRPLRDPAVNASSQFSRVPASGSDPAHSEKAEPDAERAESQEHPSREGTGMNAGKQHADGAAEAGHRAPAHQDAAAESPDD